jgi:hypothetical protein
MLRCRLTERCTVQDEVWAQASVIAWSDLLLTSFHRWTGRHLLDGQGTAAERAHQLFVSPLLVVSHGMETDPVLNYGNQAALDLWEMTWTDLIRTPSRRTAEPVNQAERAQLLGMVAERGYFDGYRGVRISSTGRRFFIEQALVWNVVNDRGRRVGQAAAFSRWRPLPESRAGE